MSTLKKMQILSDSAQYDLCDYVNHNKSSQVNLPGIYHAIGHNGCEIPLFKTLMTNKCKNDCKYCINQSKRNFTRLELSPDELAKAFLHYYNNNYVNGLFLSSGISDNVDETMEKTIETARILRKDFGYQDYIHLKIVPGASKDAIKRAMTLADRVSINIEAATKDGLNEITTTKDYNKDILKRLDWISNIGKRNPELVKAGTTTQLIIGANNESDKEVLTRMEDLYKRTNLKNSYFSAFNPVKGTDFEKRESCTKDRTNKLYQADALLNDYNYKIKELVFNNDEQLSLNEDPKILAAKEMDIFPVEINSAPYTDLIRVPGIGPKSARKIISIRRKMPFNKISDLKKLGIITKRSEPYIKISGNYQSALDNF